MSSKRKSKFVVTSFLEKDPVTQNVRMKWYCNNYSTNRIIISSYYCPFYRNGKEKGLYDRHLHKWRLEPVKLTSAHVRTSLNPEEERSYVWSWVQPDYYGIIEDGTWHYKLRLFYSIEGGGREKVAEAKSNSIHHRMIDTEYQSQMTDSIIQLLRSEFPGIRGLNPGDFEENMRSYLTTPKKLYTDMILRNDAYLLVIEIKRKATREAIRKVEKNVQEVFERFGTQMGLDTIGVLVVEELEPEVKRVAEKSGIRVLRIQISS